MNCSILVRRALLLAKLPRRRSFRARMENQISIWLSHDACLGVKWKVTRCCGSRRNASRVALDASTPDFPLTPSLSLRPETRATRRTTDSERWMLRLSQTMSHFVLGAALLSRWRRPREILFRPVIAYDAFHPARGDVKSSDKGLSAVALIFDLASLDLARHQRQPRRDALQRLNAGHFVDGDRAMSVIGTGCGLVNRTDIRALAIKGGIRFRGQPVTDAMGLEVCLFFKKRPTERCEIFGTRPRRMASSAISRWLHWLIGRSLSDGFSHVIATTAQICSGVYVAGAPDRGASARRSQTVHLSSASRHRLRQYRAVFGQTPSSRALLRTPIPSTACKMMRARSATCCGVECVRTSCSSTSRWSGKTVTGSAVSKGIATSCPSLRFVLPQHSRFDSLNFATPSGVKTSAQLY